MNLPRIRHKGDPPSPPPLGYAWTITAWQPRGNVMPHDRGKMEAIIQNILFTYGCTDLAIEHEPVYEETP